MMTARDRDTERMACWRVTADRSRELADAFFESVASGRIRSDVTAF